MREKLLEIYKALHDHFGPRGWWPAETAFEMIAGAILTQNVAWRNVVKAIEGLKKENLLDVISIHQAQEDTISRIIRPTRYHNQKTRKLKDFCSLVMDGFGGDLHRLLSLPPDGLRKKLLSVRGIGRETADSIILYAAKQPAFVVDAYTARIFSRMGLLPEKAGYDFIQKFFTGNLPTDTALFSEYHALIDGLGHHFCLAGNPRCGQCPLGFMCSTTDNKKQGLQ